MPSLTWPRVVALLIMIGILGVLSFLSWRTEFYVYAENVRIEGVKYTPQETVYQAAWVEGYHVFFLDPQLIARRVESLPYIREATVRVRLPATVYIQVVERQPVVRWLQGENTYWVDSEGVLLPPLAEGPPLIELVDPAGLAAWQGEDNRPRFNPYLVQMLLAVQDAFPDMRRVFYEPTTGLRLMLPFRGQEVQVIWGDVLVVEERLQRLEAIWAQMRQSGQAYTLIDITTPDQVIVRR